MKIKISLLFSMLLAGVMIANAQGGGGGRGMMRTPEERSKRIVDTLTTLFKLDQSQQTQTSTVFVDYNKSMDKLREGAQGGRPDQSEMEKLISDRDDKLKKVLGDDQFKKYKTEIEPAMRQRRPGGGGGGGNN